MVSTKIMVVVVMLKVTKVGPIISGPMAAHVGWRSFWWFNTGILGLALICSIFLFPETKFHRPHVGHISESHSPKTSNPEKHSTEIVEQVHGGDVEKKPLGQETNLSPLEPVRTAQDPYLGRGKPSKQQWRIFQPYSGNVFKELWLPWEVSLFPIIEFAAFVVSWSASSFLTLNLTQSQVFAAPPYNFSSQTIGFFNFAILVGALIGLFTAGPLSDYIAARLTTRNRGVREPEMRLLTMIPYVLIAILGNFIVAFGYENAWNWKVIVIIGYTAAGIQVAALPAIASTYAVDSYKPISGSIFVAITVNKNLWGYGFSKFITPWIVKDGYIPPIMTNMSLIALWCGFGVLFWYKGKTFRKWTRNSKVHSM
jgi:hypothetical protein